MSFDYKLIYLETSSFGIPSLPKSIITESLVGAMMGLLAWRFLTPEARAAWDLACSNNAFTAKPAGNTFLSTGYFQLWQLRRRAFPDPTFKTISPSLIVNYPWCLRRLSSKIVSRRSKTVRSRS
jgi:hypothetical protein